MIRFILSLLIPNRSLAFNVLLALITKNGATVKVEDKTYSIAYFIYIRQRSTTLCIRDRHLLGGVLEYYSGGCHYMAPLSNLMSEDCEKRLITSTHFRTTTPSYESGDSIFIPYLLYLLETELDINIHRKQGNKGKRRFIALLALSLPIVSFACIVLLSILGILCIEMVA